MKMIHLGLGMLLLFNSTAFAEDLKPSSQLEEQISTTLADELGADRISIRLDRGNEYPENSKVLNQGTIAIHNIDRVKHTFDITLTSPSNDQNANPEVDHIKGSFETWKQIPILKTSIDKGQLIYEDSLTSEWVKTSSIPRDASTQNSQIINSVAKHRLSEGKIIRSRDIEQPILVKRNDIVSVVYKMQNLSLQSQAVALDDGAKGARIRLRNTESKKEFMGIVDDQHTVLIPSAG